MYKFSFFAMLCLISLMFSNCQKESNNCNPAGIDNLVTRPNTTIYPYSRGTEYLLDIDGDGTNDFVCKLEQAGNHFRHLVVPVGSDNKITEIIGSGTTIDSGTVFLDRFDFNNLGTGSDAHLSNKYLGVKFKIGSATHYGWIQFSSIADGSPNSNTPIYYHKITLTFSEMVYNEGCNKPALIP